MIRALVVFLAFSLPSLALDGVAINVTTGKPQAGVDINLVQPSQNGMVQLGNATTDAQGQFKIDKQIPPGPGLLQANYEGTTYNQIITPGMATTGVQLKVYDATKKAGVARTMEHLILLEPGADRLRVSETFVLGNESNLTFNDPAKGSIQFFLPPATNGNAQVIITAPGGMPIPRPAVKTATAGIYKVDYPVKPGETRMDVSYTVPSAEKFSGKIVASDAATHLVTPGTVTVTGDGIELAGRWTTKAGGVDAAHAREPETDRCARRPVRPPPPPSSPAGVWPGRATATQGARARRCRQPPREVPSPRGER